MPILCVTCLVCVSQHYIEAIICLSRYCTIVVVCDKRTSHYSNKVVVCNTASKTSPSLPVGRVDIQITNVEETELLTHYRLLLNITHLLCLDYVDQH